MADKRKDVSEVVRKNQLRQRFSPERPLAKNNTSGRRGVSWSERRQKWRAYLRTKGRTAWLGEFTNKTDAIRAVEEVEEAIINE